MSFASAGAELIEEIGEFIWAEFLNSETPKVFEHALMIQVALERANGPLVTELFQIAHSAEYSAGAVPVSVLSLFKIIF